MYTNLLIGAPKFFFHLIQNDSHQSKAYKVLMYIPEGMNQQNVTLNERGHMHRAILLHESVFVSSLEKKHFQSRFRELE